jgi:hypothetical protein
MEDGYTKREIMGYKPKENKLLAKDPALATKLLQTTAHEHFESMSSRSCMKFTEIYVSGHVSHFFTNFSLTALSFFTNYHIMHTSIHVLCSRQ